MNTLFDDPACEAKVPALGVILALGTLAVAWDASTGGDPSLVAFICPVRIGADGGLESKALITQAARRPLWG